MTIILLLMSAAGLVFKFLNGSSTSVVGIVVPHHDMVANVRKSYLSLVAQMYQPETIILISPNHFDVGPSKILTSQDPWSTTWGLIEPDLLVVNASGIENNPEALYGDHGITSLLGDIKLYFPNAKIAPFIIRRDATYEDVGGLVNKLSNVCFNCLVISSVDFSHTNIAELADLHDTLTWRSLENLDASAIYNQAEVDSPESLLFLTLWAQIHRLKNFHLFSHTNSGYMTGNKYGEITSHIIGGYGESLSEISLVEREPAVTFIIGGDTMFARGVNLHNSESPEDTIVKVLGERFFWGVDVSLLNLEGVLSTSTNKQKLWFEMPPKMLFDPIYVKALLRARINTIAHANNHSVDGTNFENKFTKDFLNSNSIDVIGGDSVITKIDKDVKVVFIAGSQLKPFVNVSDEIKKYSNLGYVTIVYVHFGQEYEYKISNEQKFYAEALVEAGADLVVGSHPHVTQPVSVYKGVPIIYSLGNFLFDQDFSEAVTKGMILAGRVKEKHLELFLVPINTYLNPKSIDREIVSDQLNSWSEYNDVDLPDWYTFKLTNQ